MNQEEFLLNWNFQNQTVSSILNVVASESQFSDVILVSEELLSCRAHKSVLSAHSPVLKDILLRNPHSKPLIFLRGVKMNELQIIMNLMYFGEAALNIKRMETLLQVITDLQMTCFEIPLRSKMQAEKKKKEIRKIQQERIIKQQKFKAEALNENFMKEVEDCAASFYKSPIVVPSRRNNGELDCDSCNYTTPKLGHLKRHKESVHDGIKYECDVCDHKFSRKDKLKEHQKRKHHR